MGERVSKGSFLLLRTLLISCVFYGDLLVKMDYRALRERDLATEVNCSGLRGD